MIRHSTRRYATLGLAALGFAACNKPQDLAAKSKAADPPVKVSKAAVAIEKMPRYLTLTGSVLAEHQSEVAANVSGRVTATLVERGSPVRTGQVIAVVDSKQAGLSAAAAVARYQSAESQVQLAKQDCDRADKLFERGAIPQAEHERLKTQCSSQLAQANSARADADIAGKLAADTIIRAPIDGLIGERYINVGEYLSPATRVASVYSINPVRVQISVPEAAIASVQKNQELQVHVSAYPTRHFPAVVEFVSPALRKDTRDLIVEAKAKNDELLLKPGMFATVELAIGEEDLPTVPEGALKIDGTIKRMFLARDKQAYEMVVRTGVTKDGRVAILEELKAGTQVILSPPQDLKDGQAIE